MFTTSKTQDWEKSYSKFRKAIIDIETAELEFLLDVYGMMNPLIYKIEIRAISDELEFRNSSLGKELC